MLLKRSIINVSTKSYYRKWRTIDGTFNGSKQTQTANLCIVGVILVKHFDRMCFAFMVFSRGCFCLAIDLNTKFHEFSLLFYITLMFSSYIPWGFVRVRVVGLIP